MKTDTQRGAKYDALAKGFRILKSPLADSFSAAAEHFSETDAPIEEGAKKSESNAKGSSTSERTGFSS
jgi:hypothetical protein